MYFFLWRRRMGPIVRRQDCWFGDGLEQGSDSRRDRDGRERGNGSAAPRSYRLERDLRGRGTASRLDLGTRSGRE